MRAETITRANACLVQAQRDIPLAQVWGGGYVASVDGLRFVVPVRSVNTGPNPRYFGQGRGVTYLNYTSDQFTGLGGLVIAGTIRDSVYLLEALLEQESGLTPTEIMSDVASAQISAHRAGPTGLGLAQHPDRRAELSRRTVAALKRVVRDERLLEGVQVGAIGCQPLDGDDLGVLVGDGEGKAAIDAPHCPWSQPFLEPVSPSRSRSASRSVVRVSTDSR